MLMIIMAILFINQVVHHLCPVPWHMVKQSTSQQLFPNKKTVLSTATIGYTVEQLLIPTNKTATYMAPIIIVKSVVVSLKYHKKLVNL